MEKCMGLKPGEVIERLGEIRIVSVRQEPLFMITDEDCAKEGFPEMNRVDFIDMFCAHMHCNANTIVTRIEFEYVKKKGGAPEKMELDKKKETLVVQAINLSSGSLDKLYQIVQRVNEEFRKKQGDRQMSIIICRNCGYTTNSALSEWVNSKDGKADACYARLVGNKWEEGCGYNKGDNFVKQYVKDLVRKNIPSLCKEANKILFKGK